MHTRGDNNGGGGGIPVGLVLVIPSVVLMEVVC